MLLKKELEFQASIMISKYWRRHSVLKEKRRQLEEERRIDEAEQRLARDKERAFLEKMKIKMSLLQL